MNTQLTPVASATSGDPNGNLMSDIIDSLKRLERVGSENSKTTEKLIAAAQELGQKIVDQFRISTKREDVTVVDRRNKSWEDTKTHYKPEMYYFIEGGRLKNGTKDMFVDESRDAALAFSKDVALGLLEHITEGLTKREAESKTGLAHLDVAAHAIRDEATERREKENAAIRASWVNKGNSIK